MVGGFLYFPINRIGVLPSQGTIRLTRSDWIGPVNIGSDEMATIDQLDDLAMEIAGKKPGKKHIPGPLGVRGRNSDNRLIHEKLGWKPSQPLKEGMIETYRWIEYQVNENGSKGRS